MFLKTQEDINELLRSYPLENHIIEIQEWERINFESSREFWTMRINNISEFSILSSSWEGEIILEQIDSIEYMALRPNETIPVFPNNKYKYNSSWIKVLSIFKKLNHIENTIIEKMPLFINDFLIPAEKINKTIKLYEMLDKFSRFLHEKRRQLLIFHRTTLDISDRWNDQIFISFYNYYHQSFVTYFWILIRNSLDDWNRVSLKRILQKGKDIWIINEEKLNYYLNELNVFIPTLDEINNRITHLDDETFLSAVDVSRTSNTTTNITISQMNPWYVFGKISLIFDLIQEIFMKEFWILIWNNENEISSHNYSITHNQI